MVNYSDFIYEPAEDSFLLLKCSLFEIENYSKKNEILKICEVGIGSAFVISSIYDKFPKNNYVGTDINSYAIKNAEEKYLCKNLNHDIKNNPNKNSKINSNNNLKFYLGNLLDPVIEKQDLILFNTPYLPLEDGDDFENLTIKDKAIYGGKKGYEVICDFILQINDKLENDGFVLMLFSSLSNCDYICDFLKKNLFEFEIVGKESHFFEELVVLKISKSEVLKELSNINSLSNIRYLASGKHSIVLEGNYLEKTRNEQNLNEKNFKKVIIKVGKFDDIQIEEIYLRKLENYDFAPKMYFSSKNFVVREKVEADLIGDYISKSEIRDDIIKVFDNILEVCFTLDKINLNKSEMTNPYKHIYVTEGLSIKFIDFERMNVSLNPKNTRQFLEYIKRHSPILKEKGIIVNSDKIMEIAKDLKDNRRKVLFNELIN